MIVGISLKGELKTSQKQIRMALGSCVDGVWSQAVLPSPGNCPWSAESRAPTARSSCEQPPPPSTPAQAASDPIQTPSNHCPPPSEVSLCLRACKQSSSSGCGRWAPDLTQSSLSLGAGTPASSSLAWELSWVSLRLPAAVLLWQELPSPSWLGEGAAIWWRGAAPAP